MTAPDRIDLQNREFDALTALAAAWASLQRTPVVDDGYPSQRHRYEGALRTFLAAISANRGAGTESPLDVAINEVRAELASAMKMWPPFNSAHEGYAVIREELEKELWDHVCMKQKARDLGAMRKEALQVAAMGIRFAIDVCDEARGRK